MNTSPISYNRRLLRYIRKNFDYLSYIEENCDFKSTGSEELRICCPFCSESDYKCYVNPDKKFFNCFKCESSNRNKDVFNFIAEVENISVKDAIAKTIIQYREVTPEDLSLYEDEEEIVESSPTFRSVKTLDTMPEDAVRFSDDNEESSPFFSYMLSRGFSNQDVLDCGMYYVPKLSSLVYKKGKIVGDIGRRVIFPVYGGNNELVSWLARSTDPKLPKHIPKYINSPESELSKTVWPFVPPANKEIVLVEGIIDAFAVRKAGFSSYASFGKKLSEEQISLFKHWEVEGITVFLDSNAKNEIKSAVQKLRILFKNIYVVDVGDWPTNSENEALDSGSMLAYPNGLDILRKSINNRINVRNEIEYLKWSIQ